MPSSQVRSDLSFSSWVDKKSMFCGPNYLPGVVIVHIQSCDELEICFNISLLDVAVNNSARASLEPWSWAYILACLAKPLLNFT